MSILFMMPEWQAPSEVWIQRMLEELSDNLGVVVSYDTKGNKTWRGRARAISLLPQSGYARGCYNIIPRLMPDLKSYMNSVLLKEIKRHGITRVLCHYGAFATEFMDVWERVDVSLYIHFHGYDATFDLRHHDSPDRKFFNDNYLSDMLKLAERATFIANSEFTKSLLIHAGIPSKCICVKYLGVPIPDICKTHNYRKEINILHLGRLVDFKSPDRTIKAFEIARNQGVQARLIIAGDGPLRVSCELLKSRSQFRDSILILGTVSADISNDLLSNADIFTQHNIKGEISGQTECFGVSVIEAMAAGLPVVGTLSGGVTETVINGKTGIIVDPGDIEGQADAICRLARETDLRRQLGSAGHVHVLNNFTMEIEAKRLRKIMQL